MGHKSKAVFIALVVLAVSQLSLESRAAERTLIGYASPMTVRHGDTVAFKVSTVTQDAPYEADLVKIINGDSISRYGGLFEMRPVEAPFAGTYDGIVQDLDVGSYIDVEPSASLDALESFTVGAWIFPTFNPAEYTPPDLENPDPFSPPTLNIAEEIGAQTLISRFDGTTDTGWHLTLDAEYRLGFTVDTGSGEPVTVALDQPAKEWDWAYVVASYDAASGKAAVRLIEMPYAPGDQFTARDISATGVVPEPPQAGLLRIGAIRDGAGAAMATREKPGQAYTGRIQDVRIANRVLSPEEALRLAEETAPVDLSGALVMDLDFVLGIKTDRVTDISGNANHGTVVNIPERAVRGRFWKAGTVHWTADPASYDAIHLHADDLYDAEWKADFTYTVPEDLPSGVYAARLTQDDYSDYAVFFVAAPKDQPRAKLALWISTYNYLAYQNVSLGATASQNYPSHNFNHADYDFMKANLRYGTGGVYNQHVDGTYFIWGSPHRPDLHFKPDGLLIYSFSQDTHAFSFLEHEEIAYDIITDELVDREGAALLNQYDAIISSSHPEYITGPIWHALTEYTRQGGRFAYLGGNGWFWIGSENPAFPGAYETRNFLAIGERMLTSGEVGGLLIETGRTPGPVVGLEMAAMIWSGASAWQKLEDANNPRAAWIFEGTSEGDVFGEYGIDRVRPGAAGFETDKYNPENGVPRHALHLATNTEMQKTIENVQVGTLPLSISYDPSAGNWAGADIVFFETPNGGSVFSAGAITWMSSTPENGYQNDVAQITRNVIARFLDPTPFPAIPAKEVDEVERAPANPEYEHADQK